MTMNGMKKSVRWMVTFWHRDGGWRDEPDFPQISFWHPNKLESREEAARVLIELREERGDERDWIAAGHPDPFEVGPGRHPGGQWVLRYEDLDFGDDVSGVEPHGQAEDTAIRAGRRARGLKSAAGGWKGIVDTEELLKTIHEGRHGLPMAKS